jgi:hypothetical protein
LQSIIAEGILIKYNLGTGSVDLQALMDGKVRVEELSKEMRDALIACGLFEVVETEIDVPYVEAMSKT